MIDLLLGLACLLAAIVPFVLIYVLIYHNPHSGSVRWTPRAEDMNDTWLAQVVKAVLLEREPKFDEPPPRPPPSWPAVVRELAQAYASGADCAFALHDALIDAGFAHLAVDFSEADYARDCEVIRRILK